MYTSNKDGSLDVYIQKENPGKDKVSNCLQRHDGFLIRNAKNQKNVLTKY